MYNTKVVKPAPDSWGVIFDGTSYSGKVDAYDSPIYIADAAVYLKATQPDLKITDPYELTQDQFDAAVNLLKKQRKQIGNYWGSYTSQISDFKNGSIVIGADLAVPVQRARGRQAAGRRRCSQGGGDRLGRHLDALVPGQGSQLHAEVDGVRDDAARAGARRPTRSARRRPTRKACTILDKEVAELLHRLPRHRSGATSRASPTGRRR